MARAIVALSAGHQHLMRRELQLRREISTQRHAIRRAIDHGETRNVRARLEDELRALEIELRDVKHARQQAVA